MKELSSARRDSRCLARWQGVAGNPDDDPFWEAVNESRVPVSLHYAVGGARATLPPRRHRAGPEAARWPTPRCPWSRPGSSTASRTCSMVFAHGNAGWALHWLEFMDINYVRHRHLDEYTLPDPDALPSEYIRKHSWFMFHQDRSSVKNRHKLGRPT